MGISFSEYRKIIDLTPYPRPEPFGSEAELSSACDELLHFLLYERGIIAAFSASYENKRENVRRYMNERAAVPVPQDILAVQDRLFWTETLRRGVADLSECTQYPHGISLWEGDITRLNADAIVNAANKTLLGCFLPGHNCIDNIIHSRAGMQLRSDCAKIMAQQGKSEESGGTKITRAYNLPSRYVFHTVGPMILRDVDKEQRTQLRSCYLAVLNLAEEMKLNSVAFCCLSTGVFNFPREEAAEIATGTVLNWKLRHPESDLKVIFDTYLPEDTRVYEHILKMI